MKKRTRAWLVATAAVLFLTVVAAALIAPRFIDAPAVRAEIQGRLDAALGGRVSWQSLELRLLLVPHGELRRVKIEIPGKLAAEAERVQVYLRLWPLLFGRPEIASVTLDQPRLRIAPGEGEASEAQADAMATYRAVAEPLARALQEFAAETTLKLNGAELAGPVALRNFNATARSDAAGLDVEMEAESPLWKRLRVEGKLAYADLLTKASVRVDDLDASAVATLAGLDIGPMEGRVSANAVLQVGATWRADVEVVRSSASVRLAALPWPLSVQAVQIGLDEKQVSIKGARGALGESTFTDLAAQIELGSAARLSAGSGRATLRLEQWYPWLSQNVTLGPLTGLSGNLDVTLQRLALPFDKPQALGFEALAVPRAAGATLDFLPGPVAIAAGSARVDETSVRLDKVALTLLDTRAIVSGAIAFRGPKVELSLADGSTGDQVLRWALDKARAPADLALKTPIRVAARRIAWERSGGLVLDAATTVDAGPGLEVQLAWTPQRLELRRLAIKDAQSDAIFSAIVASDLLRVGFSGLLQARSLAALRKQPEPRSGRIQGKLSLIVDRERPLLTMADGRLSVQALDLSVLAGRPAMLERAELTAERSDLLIERARLIVDEQVLDLSGKVSGTEQGPVLDARLESPGVVMERLLPPRKPPAQGETSKLWPLPVTGRVAVRAGYLQFGENRIAPLEGTAVLEAERVRLDVQQARMCGVSFPLQMDATPELYNIAARLAMKDEPFDKAIHCLTGGAMRLTGNADLRADLRTRGRDREEFLRNLAGNAEAELRKGRIERFALIGNILSVQNLRSIRDPREIDKGFLYRSMTAKGHFEGGAFVVEEGFLDSDAARIAVNGNVDLLGNRSHLNVLVGLLSSVDRVTGAIPILGNVLGGTLIALPVEVRGDIRDPLVIPLGPRAISDRLLGVFERTLKLPGKLVPAEKEPKP